MSIANPPAGYYADPSVPGYIRYWDGNEWVAGSSRPAPEQPAETPSTGDAPGQRSVGRQQGLTQSGARHYGQAPQQHAPNPTPSQTPSPTPAPSSSPAPTPMPFAQPASGLASAPAVTPAPPPTPMPFAPSQPQPASSADEIFESVGTMIVPSAFARAARSGNSYSFPGQTSNPFAGLPSSEFVAPGEEPRAPEVTVVELASPGSRILARIIDLGIALVFSAPLTITFLLIAHQHDHQYVLKLDAQATNTYTTLGMDGLGIALWVGALLALMIVAIVYEGNRLSRGGQTIGRRLAGVRVVRMPEGLPLGRDGVGTRRALLFWVLAIIPVVDVLALGGVFWGRPYQQGLHEKLTSTATIKA